LKLRPPPALVQPRVDRPTQLQPRSLSIRTQGQVSQLANTLRRTCCRPERGICHPPPRGRFHSGFHRHPPSAVLRACAAPPPLAPQYRARPRPSHASRGAIMCLRSLGAQISPAQGRSSPPCAEQPYPAAHQIMASPNTAGTRNAFATSARGRWDGILGNVACLLGNVLKTFFS